MEQIRTVAERLEAEAKAIAAVKVNGVSITRAAELHAVPYTTLHRRLAWLNGAHPQEREIRLREAEEELLSLTMVTAMAAQAELARRVLEDPKSLATKELVPIAGMSQDKLAIRRGWEQGGISGAQAGVGVLADALARLGGGEITVRVGHTPPGTVVDAPSSHASGYIDAEALLPRDEG